MVPYIWVGYTDISFYSCIKSLGRCSTFVAGGSMRLPTSLTRQSKLCISCCTHLCVSLTPRKFIVSILYLDLLGLLNCSVSSPSLEISIGLSWFLQMHEDYMSYRLNSIDYVSKIIRNGENSSDVGVGWQPNWAIRELFTGFRCVHERMFHVKHWKRIFFNPKK